jgi:hypothetical protein
VLVNKFYKLNILGLHQKTKEGDAALMNVVIKKKKAQEALQKNLT